MMECQQRVRGFLSLLAMILAFDVIVTIALAGDTINRTRTIRDGDTGLVSSDGRFELGFFSLGRSSSKKRYVGIWFRNISTGNIVWVANRRVPLNDSAGVLKFGESGKLVIEDSAGAAVWQSSAGAGGIRNPVAQLLDTGNFVVRDGDASSNSAVDYIWQSFEEPGDTLISGIKLGVNRSRGVSTELMSWTTDDDPSPGIYSFRMDPGLLPSLTLLKGTTVRFSSGFWNGKRFSGIPEMLFVDSYNTIFVSAKDGYSYSLEPMTNHTITKLVVNSVGTVTRQTWNARTSTWVNFLTGPGDDCDVFGTCGPYGVCNVNVAPICQCPSGFRPRSEQDWYNRDGSGGCVREKELQCDGSDGFLTLRKIKLPSARNMTVFEGMDLEECRRNCLSNCLCTAYAPTEIPGGRSGCLAWFGELIDIRTIAGEQDEIYLRVPAALADPAAPVGGGKKKRSGVVVACMASGLVLLLLLCAAGLWIRKRRKKATSTASYDNTQRRLSTNLSVVVGEGAGLPLLGFETIVLATDDFSPSNKIGEGGFGAVYKGVLEEGQEVAVKRLSWTSTDGKNDFINEANLIAKLQHRNLVRLIGFCVQGDERMLIYEYMKNSSLDTFIFDRSKRALLDWNSRLDIILGIAKGVMYLHHDSRYKIIHRDLKAGNVLLDGDMNPKISDFGTARIFGANQNMEKTRRVIGTYGYMAPEYALSGTISIKSDVFSFGVLTLEVLSGKKSQEMVYTDDSHLNLLSYGWKLWQEGNCLEFLDETLTSSPLNTVQILRCIQIALLCVQERATDRPTMSTVVMMLSNESFTLSQPKRPGFLAFASHDGTAASPNKENVTDNELTITVVTGR